MQISLQDVRTVIVLVNRKVATLPKAVVEVLLREVNALLTGQVKHARVVVDPQGVPAVQADLAAAAAATEAVPDRPAEIRRVALGHLLPHQDQKGMMIGELVSLQIR